MGNGDGIYLAAQHNHFVCPIFFESFDNGLAYASSSSEDCDDDHDASFRSRR